MLFVFRQDLVTYLCLSKIQFVEQAILDFTVDLLP